jgi:hypothetical protein
MGLRSPRPLFLNPVSMACSLTNCFSGNLGGAQVKVSPSGVLG